MTDEEKQEYNDKLDLFAGIALAGLCKDYLMWKTDGELANAAFCIAEAMMVESKRRRECEQQ
jgi:hypothetical protein